MAGYKFTSQFTTEVTHVIVKTVAPEVHYCERTLKYFQGIAHKCWILSYKWIQESLDNDQVLKENDYEISGDSVNGAHHRGPTRSRLSHTPLLRLYQIHVIGESNELRLDELGNLIKVLGGELVTHPKSFDLKSGKTHLIVAGNQQSTNTSKWTQSFRKEHGVLMVTREWVLDSIAMYQTQPFDSYILLL